MAAQRSAPSLRPLVPAAHAAALLLVLVPILDYVAAVWPALPGEYRWRYGAAGLLSGFVLTPLLGVLLAALTAAVAGQRRALLWLGRASLAAGVLLAAALGLFALDVLQVGSGVDHGGQGLFLAGAAKAALKLGFVAGWLALLGRGAVRAGRALAPTRDADGRAQRSQLVAAARAAYGSRRGGPAVAPAEEALPAGV